MMHGPNVQGNPLKIAVGLLVVSYIIGEFVFPKYPLSYFIQLIGISGLFISLAILITGFNSFKSYNEDPTPIPIIIH